MLSQRLWMQHECSSSKSIVNQRNNLLLGQEVEQTCRLGEIRGSEGSSGGDSRLNIEVSTHSIRDNAP